MRTLFIAAARKPVCLASLFITTVLTLLVWKIDTALAGTGGKGSIYLQLSFTEGTFTDILASWHSGGVDMMMNAGWLYFLYPVACAVLLSSAVAFFTLLRRGGGSPAMSDLFSFALPLAGGTAGVAAQALLRIIFGSGALSASLILAESVTASLSWALFIISIVLVLRSYFLFRKNRKGSAG